jgi:hypothetical protein
MLKWGAWNVALFELSLGVVALAALPVALVGMLRCEARPSVRSTGVVTLTLGLSLLASVALLSASPYGLRILHERNLFYVTPLVLTCMAHWLWRGLERPFWRTAICAGAVVMLAALLPERLIHTNNVDAPSASFFLALETKIPSVHFRVWVVSIAVVGAATFLFAKRSLFPILTVVLAFVAVTTEVDYRDSLTAAQSRALSWVDRNVPANSSARLIYFGIPYVNGECQATDKAQQDLTVWTEFFNTHVGAVAHVHRPNPADGLRSPRLTVAPGGLARDKGKRGPTYVVIDSRQSLVGKRLSRLDYSSIRGDQPGGRASLTLWHIGPRLRFKPLPATASGVDGPNLVGNSGFEAKTTGWAANAGTERVARTTSEAVSGVSSMEIATAGSRFSGAFHRTRIPINPKTNYTFSFYAKGSSGETVVLPLFNGTPGAARLRA